MKKEKKQKRPIPDKPKVPLPQRKSTPTLGTATKQRGTLDSTTVEAENEFELRARNEWERRETDGFGSVYLKR